PAPGRPRARRWPIGRGSGRAGRRCGSAVRGSARRCGSSAGAGRRGSPAGCWRFDQAEARQGRRCSYIMVPIMTEELTVEHDAGAKRFRVAMQGYEAVLMYRTAGNDIDLYHTYVPEVFRGRGIAEKLCKAAFEHAKAS